MRVCCCTNQCPACGQCCAVGCAHRGGANQGWTTGKVTITNPPLPPLTEEAIRRIIREELGKARS